MKFNPRFSVWYVVPYQNTTASSHARFVPVYVLVLYSMLGFFSINILGYECVCTEKSKKCTSDVRMMQLNNQKICQTLMSDDKITLYSSYGRWLKSFGTQQLLLYHHNTFFIGTWTLEVILKQKQESYLTTVQREILPVTAHKVS